MSPPPVHCNALCIVSYIIFIFIYMNITYAPGAYKTCHPNIMSVYNNIKNIRLYICFYIINLFLFFAYIISTFLLCTCFYHFNVVVE